MSGLSVGGGLARGLSKVLLAKRVQDRDEALRAEDRQHNLKVSLFAKGVEEGLNPDDLMAAIGLDFNFGEKKPKGKNGAPDPNEVMSGLLNATGGQPAGGPESPTAFIQNDVNKVATQATAQEPKPKTLFGLELPTDEEKTAKAIETRKAVVGGESQAQIDAKLDAAARLRSLDPKLSVEQSLIEVGLRSKPEDRYKTLPVGAGVYDTVEGTIKEPASAKVEKLTGQLGDRTREIMALNPDIDEPTARAEAAKALASERADEALAKQASAAAIQSNRAIQGLLLKMQADAGGITPNNAASLTTQLRRDFEKAAAPFKARQTYVAKLDEALRHITDKTDVNGKPDPNYRITAAQNVVNSFNRILEETNTVKEGEYKRSEEMAPIVTRVEAFLDRLTRGGNTLTDEQLKSIAQEGKQIATVVGQVYEEGLRDTRTAMERQLAKYKIPAEDVFGNSTLGKPKGEFSAVLDGKSYGFDTQAKLDAFKRQFPNAK